MRYRDERDALRGRVDSLEEQLATARKQLDDHSDDDRAARVEQLERQMADARRVLDQLGRELDAVRGRPRRSLVAPVLAMIAGLGICGAVLGHLLLRPASEAPADGALQPVLVPAPPPEPTSMAPEPAPAPPAPAPERPLRTATATWQAAVARATGLPLAAGAPCTVTAELASAGDDIRVPSLQVVCGGKPIYRSSDPLNGMSMFSSGVEEDSGAEPGTQVYAISYQDKGTRAGERAEVSLDSIRRAGAVWSDAAPAYRVELTLAYQSPPVAGEPLLDATKNTLHRAAGVTESTGPSPVKAGARCALRVSPLPRGGKCLTRLACSGRMLYGAGTTGVSECAVEGGRVVRVHDGNTTQHGGDPALDLDLATGRLTVRDEGERGAWSVGVQLDPVAGEGQ
ncbi:hypothetical protein [Sorangium cellulosum]|uniref:Uncharacterized protein n=1 Tax=Sorangium cellulosum TaxID=56 RepID=A0A150QCZ6_SORCE|nr:hypothetical protein [Sorangium cellulosum]KYF65793.1 hypothetical protein BE15_30050 [Sorangium cellulosum]